MFPERMDIGRTETPLPVFFFFFNGSVALLATTGRHDALHSALDPVVSAPLQKSVVEHQGRKAVTHLFGRSSQMPVESVVRLSNLAAELGAPRAIHLNWDSVRLTP